MTTEDGLSGSNEPLGLKENRSYRNGQPSESESMACGKRYMRNVGGPYASPARAGVCAVTNRIGANGHEGVRPIHSSLSAGEPRTCALQPAGTAKGSAR